MLIGMKTVPMTRSQEEELEVVELGILLSIEVTRLDNTSNKHIRETARIHQFEDKSIEVRRRWLSHVQRKGRKFV